MGTTPDEIRNEIENTRAELGVDVDRIVDRTSPRRVMRRRAGRARAVIRGARERIMGLPEGSWPDADSEQGIAGTAHGAVQSANGTVRERGGQAAQTARHRKDQAMETAEQAVETAKHGAQQAADAVEAAPGMAKERARANPLGAGVIAFGVGLVAASLLPSASAERVAGRRVREHASDVAEPLKRVAAEPAQRLASETGETVRDAAQKVGDTAGTTGQQARDQGEDVAGHVQESAGNVRDHSG